MREQEMRLRVFRFLRTRMRNMIMPATVGIGLAIGGCDGPVPVYSASLQDSAAPSKSDVLGPDSPATGPDLPMADTRDGRLAEDAASDISFVQDVSAADQRDAVATADLDTGSDGAGPDDAVADVWAKKDANPNQDATGMKYFAPFLDGATVPVDGAAETGAIVTKYIAPILDSGLKDSLPIRYGAVTPDGGSDSAFYTLYMAPQQG